MADLKSYVPENDTITIELEHEGEVLKNDDGTPMTVEMYLPHTKKYREVRHKQSDDLIEKRRQFEETNPEDRFRLSSFEAEEMGLELLVNTTKTWNITYGGKQPKLTPAKVREVYENIPWVPEQIVEKTAKNRGFTKA